MGKNNKKINSAILVIGNEILSGRTQDLNVSFLTLDHILPTINSNIQTNKEYISEE